MDEEKQTNERRKDHLGPSTERGGSVGQEKKQNARTKLPSSITQETLETLTLKIPKHLKQPKGKDEDLKTEKAPGTTQGENANP